MSEGLGNPIESLAHGLLDIAIGIGAIALGLHFFKKAKDGGKKPDSNKS